MATIANDTQFIGISPTIDLTGKKSAILNEQTIPVTMDDITSTVRPYNVFTALLTQSGGDSLATVTSGVPIVIGVSYLISGNDGNTADFTNIGAPNNDEGTYFIATGTTPNSWGEFENAELTYNTGAPVATVLENTIGNVWFTYNDVGDYRINSDGLFIENKSTFSIEQNNNNGGGGNGNFIFYQIFRSDNNFAIINNLDVDLANGNSPSGNDLLNQNPIEIRVYE